MSRLEDRAERDRIASQIEELLAGPAVAQMTVRVAAARMPRGAASPARRRVWTDIENRYLARQTSVATDARAAVLSAGAPGAGKTSVITGLGRIDDSWRRLDADVIKDYLVAELAGSGAADSVLNHRLSDGQTVMPRELAGVVHAESVAILDEVRRGCVRRGENVVIEGTLSWPPAARQLLAGLADAGYREVSFIDVEVRLDVAAERARQRWWTGRLTNSDGLGGRWVPPAAIEQLYLPGQLRSVCANNVRAALETDAAAEVEIARVTIVDDTGPSRLVETHELRHGAVQTHPQPEQLVLPDTTTPAVSRTAAQIAAPSLHPRSGPTRRAGPPSDASHDQPPPPSTSPFSHGRAL